MYTFSITHHHKALTAYIFLRITRMYIFSKPFKLEIPEISKSNND